MFLLEPNELRIHVVRHKSRVTPYSRVTDGNDTRWVEAKAATVSQVELSREEKERRLSVAVR